MEVVTQPRGGVAIEIEPIYYSFIKTIELQLEQK